MRKAAQGHANTEVLTPVIAIAVMELIASRDYDQTAARSVALMRHGFGGHPFGPDAAIQRERQRGALMPVAKEAGLGGVPFLTARQSLSPICCKKVTRS